MQIFSIFYKKNALFLAIISNDFKEFGLMKKYQIWGKFGESTARKPAPLLALIAFLGNKGGPIIRPNNRLSVQIMP